MPNWYYEKSNLKKTPSYLTGLDFDTETRYRREGARETFKNLLIQKQPFTLGSVSGLSRKLGRLSVCGMTQWPQLQFTFTGFGIGLKILFLHPLVTDSTWSIVSKSFHDM